MSLCTAYWERFTYDSNVQQETGYRPDVLDYVWEKYGMWLQLHLVFVNNIYI